MKSPNNTFVKNKNVDMAITYDLSKKIINYI